MIYLSLYIFLNSLNALAQKNNNMCAVENLLLFFLPSHSFSLYPVAMQNPGWFSAIDK